jgi:hypothetical protein
MVYFASVMGALLTWHRDSSGTENVCARVLCACCFHLSHVKAWHWFSGVWLFIVVFP